MTTYYNLDRREELPGTSFNKPMECLACKSIIRGQGGGGDHICNDCYTLLRSFRIHHLFREYKYGEKD